MCFLIFRFSFLLTCFHNRYYRYLLNVLVVSHLASCDIHNIFHMRLSLQAVFVFCSANILPYHQRLYWLPVFGNPMSVFLFVVYVLHSFLSVVLSGFS